MAGLTVNSVLMCCTWRPNLQTKISNFNFNDIIEDSSDISFSVFSEHPDLGTIEFEEMVSEVFLDILRIGLELFDSDDKNQ